MDLRSYYRKVQEAENGLTGEQFVVVSLETSEGGRAGVPTEVARRIAAKLIAETRARLATEEEARAFRDLHRDAREKHQQDEVAKRVQVMVIPSHQLPKQRERS